MSDHVEACPHCGVTSQFVQHQLSFAGVTYAHVGGRRQSPDRIVALLVCRNCHGFLIDLSRAVAVLVGPPGDGPDWKTERIYPTKLRPPALPEDVPQDLRDAYTEAWMLQPHSEAAAAVMARRCLQLTLRKQGIIKKNLAAEIEAAEEQVGSDLALQLHYVRELGNIGAHPIDAEGGNSFDELLDVQPGELLALFAAIREAFDEFYVKPARRKSDREALNAKLLAAGRQPLKSKGGQST